MKKIICILLVSISFLTPFLTKIYAVTSKWCIAIDAGHGGMDSGACVNGIKESAITLAISKKIKEVFEKKEIDVLLTRTTEDALVSGKFIKRKDMTERVNKINNSSAILAISIHLNNFSIEKYSGPQIFFNPINEFNKHLADTIQKNMVSYLKTIDRKPMIRKNIFLLNKVLKPCCIVECGFMSNSEEFLSLQSEEYQYKIAHSLYYAIEEFLKLY